MSDLGVSRLPFDPLSGGLDALQRSSLERAERQAGDQDANTAGVGFEKLFATMLVREMRKSARTFEDGGLFGSSSGADVYESWFDEHVGDVLSERDLLGIAGMVKAAVQRTDAAQGASDAPDADAPAPALRALRAEDAR